MASSSRADDELGAGEWPLDKITEPHDRNDVLWHSDKKAAAELFASGVLFTAAREYEYCTGNQRFRDQLRDRLDDYESKNRLTKPLVALDLLKQWRGQTPPGRFLVLDETTNLWKDVRDKQARTIISKALKQLAAEPKSEYVCCGCPPSCDSITNTCTTSSTSDCSQQACVIPPLEPSAELSPPASCDAHADMSESNSSSGACPQLPKFPRPQKNYRRISEALKAARAKGAISGRWQERDRLTALLQKKIDQGKAAASSSMDDSDVVDSVSDIVFLRGEMGVGKSALAHTLKCPPVNEEDEEEEETRGETRISFFLEGKFEYVASTNPYKVFVEVFTDFCHQLLGQQNADLTNKYRSAIRTSLRDDMDTLIGLIPALERVLRDANEASSKRHTNHDDDQSEMSPLGGTGGSRGISVDQRATSLFVSLLQSIASVSPERPLVIFLDDLHWAQELSVDILHSLIEDAETGVLFLASLRDEDEQCCSSSCSFNAQSDKLMNRLNASHTVQVHTIDMQNLRENDVQFFLEDALQCDYSQTRSVSKLVYSLTGGNPMFISELLRNFQEKGLICVDDKSKQWVCDVEQIHTSYQNVTTVSDLFEMKVLELPLEAQKTLKYAACLGSSQINEPLMEVLCGGDLEAHLQSATKAGLVRQNKQQGYHFVSDGVQLAIYNLIADETRPSYHLDIGKKLWTSMEDPGKEEVAHIFRLLDQLMMGEALLKEDDDRRSVASLCLVAGERAARSSGFQTAWVYLRFGLHLLSANEVKLWGRDNYDLSLRLHNALIEVAYCTARFSTLDELIGEILRHARTFDDSLLARSTQIYSLGSRNNLPGAISSGLRSLEELGEKLPSNPSSQQQKRVFRMTRRLMNGHSDDSILGLRPMRNKTKLAAMQLLNHMFLYAYYSRPHLATLIACRMVKLTLSHGLCAISSVALSFYSMFACGFESTEQGYRYGKLSLQLLDMFKTEAWLCRTWSFFYGSVAGWKDALDTTIAPLQKAYAIGLRTGDIEYAMLNGSTICWNCSDSLPLPELEAQIRKVAAAMELSGHTLALSMLRPTWVFAKAFSIGPDVADPRKQFLDLVTQNCAKALADANEGVLLWTRAITMATAYIFLDYDVAEQYTVAVHKIYENMAYCGVGSAFVLFFECMSLLATAHTKGFLSRIRVLRYVRRRLRKLQGWAHRSPENLLPKMYIMQGEFAAVTNDYQSACADFRSAILHAQRRRSLFEEALANERLATCMLAQGDSEAAQPFLDAAHGRYLAWGAPAKARHMKIFYVLARVADEQPAHRP